MTNTPVTSTQHQPPGHETVFQAIRDSWCAETCGTPNEWSPDNPAWGQCDASAFVAWEYLGGELVLGKVFLNGQETEHHYWNRIDGNDIDLTSSQLADGQEIRQVEVLSHSFIEANAAAMKLDVQARIAVLRDLVRAKLELCDTESDADRGALARDAS